VPGAGAEGVLTLLPLAVAQFQTTDVAVATAAICSGRSRHLLVARRILSLSRCSDGCSWPCSAVSGGGGAGQVLQALRREDGSNLLRAVGLHTNVLQVRRL
jgi:hypothetical protein